MPTTHEPTDTEQLVARLSVIEIVDPTFASDLLRRADERLVALGCGLSDHEKEVLDRSNLRHEVAMKAKATQLAADPNRKIPGLTEAENEQVRRLGLNPESALRALRHIRAQRLRGSTSSVGGSTRL